jgi:hypothetical protein
MRPVNTPASRLPPILAAALSCVFLTPFASACRGAEREATVSVASTALAPVHVYVNGQKVGSLGRFDVSEKFTFTPAKDGKNTLYVEVELLVGKNLKSSEYAFDAKDGGEVVLGVDHNNLIGLTVVVKTTKVGEEKDRGGGRLLGVKLDPEVEERELASEVVETPAGVEQEYELSRTLERSVSFSERVSVEFGGRVDWKILGGDIRRKIESEANQTFRQTETIRRNLKIDGSKTPKVKVVWVGTFRTGRATVSLDGEEKVLPFAFQVGLKPKLSVVKD